MSRYKSYSLKINNRDSLIAAIQLAEIPFEKSDGNDISLHRYSHRDQEQMAEIVIRKEALDSRYNDLGFVRKTDGSYDALVGDYGKGAATLDTIRQNYAVIQNTRLLKAKGYTVSQTKLPGGAIELVATLY